MCQLVLVLAVNTPQESHDQSNITVRSYPRHASSDGRATVGPQTYTSHGESAVSRHLLD